MAEGLEPSLGHRAGAAASGDLGRADAREQRGTDEGAVFGGL